MHKKRRIIALIICCCMFFTILGSVGYAKEIFVGLKDKVLETKPTKDSGTFITPSARTDKAIPTFNISGQKKVLYKTTRDFVYLNTTNKDKYNFYQNDIEELLKEGYSIQDLYKADEIGNKLDVDPRQLLKDKKVKNSSWDSIEKEHKLQKNLSEFNRLKNKYKQESGFLVKEGLKDDEQFLLLLGFDQQSGVSISELVNTYRSKGEPGLVNIISENKKASREQLSALGISPDSLNGMSLKTLEKIKTRAQKAGVPVKDFIKNVKKSKNGIQK